MLIVGVIALLSGAAALIFEVLWFRQAGLAFGNSVWAASLVLAAFMAGLALGNGLAGKRIGRVKNPLLLYAFIELAIGSSGFILSIGLPWIGVALAPLFRPILDSPLLINPVRLLFAYAALLVPTTAMGATLPVLVQALSRADPRFGRVLGRLYGINTFGAVLGSLSAELVLVEALGITGTAWFAAGLNATAAATAYALSTRPVTAPATESAEGPGGPISPAQRRLLLAAFLCGLLLLALEVVWSRFLQLFVVSTSWAMAVILATVLVGIGLGGLLAGQWLSSHPSAPRHTSSVALLAGAATAIAYATFLRAGTDPWAAWAGDWSAVSSMTVRLIFLVSLLSGVLFTLIGTALKDGAIAAGRAAGLLTLANTVGAMLGAILGGFVLLPGIGMEGSFFVLALGYGLVAWVLPSAQRSPLFGRGRWLAWGLLGLFVVSMAAFPWGIMNKRYLRFPAKRYAERGMKIVSVREGLAETILYIGKFWRDRPVYYRMLTNGYSMSSTMLSARRYMKVYVYLPIALHPKPKKALLISYGVGMTAKALTDTKELESIDVVDISRDILDMNKIVFPEAKDLPLNDPRVKVHIEDGRYFLQTSSERFDLITGEPPPPKATGIVNLYTQEYFQLMYDRLAEGGMVTYWLPVDELLETDTKAIAAGFCLVFEDCALWSGAGLQWMLTGSRGASGPVTADRLRKQWEDPSISPELLAIGLERPEQLGAMFIGDASFLAEFTRGVPPLVDEYPKRLAAALPGRSAPEMFLYSGITLRTDEARVRFEESALARRLWPAELKPQALEAFAAQRLVSQHFLDLFFFRQHPWLDHIGSIHESLTQTPLKTLPLWLLGSDLNEQQVVQEEVAKGEPEQTFLGQLAYGAIADRDWARALQHLEKARHATPEDLRLRLLELYVLALTGDRTKAEALAGPLAAEHGKKPELQAYWAFMTQTFGPLAPLAANFEVGAPRQ